MAAAGMVAVSRPAEPYFKKSRRDGVIVFLSERGVSARRQEEFSIPRLRDCREAFDGGKKERAARWWRPL
jgi:translation initiation factor RLI1